MTVHLPFAREPQTHLLRIRVEKAADELPYQPHIVRVTDWSATWKVRPQLN